MTRSPRSGRRRKKSLLSKLILGSAALTMVASQYSRATGFYGPLLYFDQGGKNLLASPEFYWELEVKRLSKGFTPEEKRIPAPAGNESDQGESGEQGDQDKSGSDPRTEMTSDADLQDFATALQEGRIKPDDPEKAKAQHQAARTFILAADQNTTGSLPDEFPSEFADYHRGALAYREHKWDQARTEWEALLKRPAEERHYRTVWATFMLGKTALKQGVPGAVKYFESTRELAKAGFTDSLGMAADSYGWEGRSKWKQGHPEAAARLFLAQLALGDTSAIVSLKALIPDREPLDGMLNYGLEPDQKQALSDDQKKAEQQKTLLALKTAAADPLLRRLVTVHILSTESAAFSEDETGTAKPDRCTRWLSVIRDAHIEQVEDAEYLGWVAYLKGMYSDAGHWLQLSKGDTPAAYWLRAKLQRRDGRLDEASKSMALAWQAIDPITTYTGWTASPDPREHEFVIASEGGNWSFPQSASGDLAGLQLEHANFIPALEVLIKGGLWDDTAFVAERVLTADELKMYIDGHPGIPQQSDTETEDPIAKLRYLLGRRFVREDRYEEAAHYLKKPYDQVLTHYVKALQDGANQKLSKRDRAKAWFTAAWLARYDGMELMGTEGAPDGFAYGGDFVIPDIAKQQQTGFYQITNYENDQDKLINVPAAVRAPQSEIVRLAKNKIVPDVRFHYRLIAGTLAVRAADFLDDNSEELADVLNTAGLWVKDRDEKTGDRYYQILEKRAPKTTVGRLAIAKHWFVDQPGPWAKEQEAALAKLHQELSIKDQ